MAWCARLKSGHLQLLRGLGEGVRERRKGVSGVVDQGVDRPLRRGVAGVAVVGHQLVGGVKDSMARPGQLGGDGVEQGRVNAVLGGHADSLWQRGRTLTRLRTARGGGGEHRPLGASCTAIGSAALHKDVQHGTPR